MKKIISCILAVVLMMSMTVTAFAVGEQSGTTTLTAVVPELIPEYTIHIPADMTLEYGNADPQEIGTLYASDFKNIRGDVRYKVTYTDLIYGGFTGAETIPVYYSFTLFDSGQSDLTASLDYPMVDANVEEDAIYHLFATVSASDWENASPGTYIATMTFNFYIED